MGPVSAFRIEDVVERGICVGCGACSAATGGKVSVTLGRLGVHSADLAGAGEEDRRRASRVCPFSDEAPDEDALDVPDPASRHLPHDPRTGRHGRVLAGRRVGTDTLLESSSGGLTSWLLAALLRSGEVDAVVHVARDGAEGGLFGYVVSDAAEAVEERKKSYYTAPTLAGVLEQVRARPGRYALVGVPCFVKAARALQREDPVLAERLTLFVGLVCGHLKSTFFAESLAWQAGVPPERLADFDFRVKNPDRPANRYDYAARAAGTTGPVVREVASAIDGSWGTGAFQPAACDFCDDVFAETADVVLGDAWLPEYVDEWRGTNVVVTRNAVVDALLDEGVAAGELELAPLDLEAAVASQGGNFRHRRDGLRVRLADDLAAGLPVPRKRVEPGLDHVTAERRALIRRRRALSVLSLERFAAARAAGDLTLYTAPMRAAVAGVRPARAPLTRRIAARFRRLLRR